MKNKFKLLFHKYISDNLGLVNIIGKSFGRILYLLLLGYFSYKLSINHFAEFAIFWSSLRMFSFYGNNNLHIIYFNKVREHLIEKKEWPIQVSTNIIITSIFFCAIIAIISIYLFQELEIVLLLVGCLISFIIIRNISEFAKVDNNLFLSIFIDDILFYVLFFFFSITGLFFFNDIHAVIYALFLASILTALTGFYLFVRKFEIKIKSYKIIFKYFSLVDFKLGLNYTFLRGNEVLSNFAVRYLGQIYFGDLFVAYAHIMYQFYNIFSLLTMSTVSGLQSKITAKNLSEFNRQYFNLSYKKIQKTLFPFIIALTVVLILFGNHILLWFFPKFSTYGNLLTKVSFLGIIYSIIQPLIFVLVYNNQFANIMKLNFTQYLIMILLFVLPTIQTNINEQSWFLLVMISLCLVQGLFALLNYTNIK